MEIIEVVKELNIVDNSEALIDELVGAISLDPVSIKNLAKKIGNMPLYFRDAWYWLKFKEFIYGVKDIQDNLGEGVSISAKLFGSDKDKKRRL